MTITSLPVAGVEIKCSADDFKLTPTDSIIPNPKNNNRHSVEQINRLAKLILHHGFRDPLIISRQSGFLNCGHARLEAAKQLGMMNVPVIFQDFKNEAEEYQHMTADNEIARWAELDYQSVYEMLDQMPELDKELLGIDDFKIDDGFEESNEEVHDVEQFIVSIQCKDETDMSIIYDEMLRRGYECKLIR